MGVSVPCICLLGLMTVFAGARSTESPVCAEEDGVSLLQARVGGGRGEDPARAEGPAAGAVATAKEVQAEAALANTAASAKDFETRVGSSGDQEAVQAKGPLAGASATTKEVQAEAALASAAAAAKDFEMRTESSGGEEAAQAKRLTASAPETAKEAVQAKAALASAAAAAKDFQMKACLAEFVAMALFVFIGCGSAMSVAKAQAWVLQVSLTFGIAITVLAYTIGQYSGGHINCAVTFGLVITGNCSWQQGVGNLVAQLLGSVVGAMILWLAYSGIPQESLDRTGGLGTNTVGEGVPVGSALIMEAAGTFVLMYVVLETAVNKVNSVGHLAPLAIGFAVFLIHSVLISVDGCSINPTRTTGPAIVNAIMNPKSDGKAMKQLWIFWLGPLAGAAAAAALYTAMKE